MNIDQEVRKKILNILLQQRGNFDGSDAQYALSFDINKSIYNRLKNGETEKVLSDKKWITIARHLGVQLGDEIQWYKGETNVFQYITTQMTICKAEGISGMFCDRPETGKTFAAQWFCTNTKNSIYIDCSLNKSKDDFVRAISKGFGLNYTAKYKDVFADLAYYLNVIHKPFIALDEAGDLSYGAELEIKALWNAAPYRCGWYKLGAEGLKKKLERNQIMEKVGYAENNSRFGNKFNRLTPVVADENLEFWKEEALAIIKANAPAGTDIQTLLTKANGSNRVLRNQLIKLKRQS